MRFKSQRSNSQLPEVNLVPMMDVLMTVLTFFIIVSMTLTGQQIANVNLPRTKGTDKGENPTDLSNKVTLVVGLNSSKAIVVENQPVTTEQLAKQMQAFLTKNPDGIVMLKADRGLSYQDVNQLLKTMRDIGGSQVVLAFDRQS